MSDAPSLGLSQVVSRYENPFAEHIRVKSFLAEVDDPAITRNRYFMSLEQT
jgi:hypothetical protein